MAVSGDYVPSAGELTAHVRTAVDASIRWIDRTLNTPVKDTETWEQRSFYARIILMRGLERGELLGWVLQRDSLAAEGTDRETGIKTAAEHWHQARPDLHNAMAHLRRSADLDPKYPSGRDPLKVARDDLEMGRNWLANLADTLAVTNRSVQLERERSPERPEPTYGRDFL